MSRRGWWLVVIGFALGAVVAGLVATLVVTRGGEPAEIAEGDVFSTDAGDPIDLFYGPGDRGLGCMNVGAFFYGSTISCFDLETVDETGSYDLVIADSKRNPPLVVGVMPAGTSAATVLVGSTSVHANTRGRWFLASLEPGALGPQNDAPVVVRFDRS